MKCPKCGHEMRRGSTFCDQCGCRLQESKPKKSPAEKKLLIAVCCAAGVALIMIIAVVVLLLPSCNNQSNDKAQTAATTVAATVAPTTESGDKQSSNSQQSETDIESSQTDNQESGNTEAAEDSSADGTDLAVYFNTDVSDFPNHVSDVSEAPASDGSNGWQNQNLLVQTTPNQFSIDYIALFGECEYTIYGIKPGMSSDEAKSLAEAAGYTMTSEGQYSGEGIHMQIGYEGDSVKNIILTKSD